jgi:hypothetical protein
MARRLCRPSLLQPWQRCSRRVGALPPRHIPAAALTGCCSGNGMLLTCLALGNIISNTL